MGPVLILGHGQLGLMLAAEGARLGLDIDRVDLATGERLKGTSPRRAALDRETIRRRYAVVTAELEHLPDDDFVGAVKRAPNWANAAAFDLLVDRARQKALLDELGLPTAPWARLDAEADFKRAFARLGEPLVVKTTTGGYDGRGQWRVRRGDAADLPGAAFGRLIAESFVDFRREISLIGARSRAGRCCFLPIAENVHERGILRYSIVRQAVEREPQERAQRLLARVMERLGHVGVMAMECFESDAGLSINELAPRVHNSGHWSQLGLVHNQFALHLRALLELPLPVRQRHRATLMLNLIGCEFNPGWLAVEGAQVHWYGKERRPGRKMGHVNLDAGDRDALAGTVESLCAELDAEHRRLLLEAARKF